MTTKTTAELLEPVGAGRDIGSAIGAFRTSLRPKD